MYTIYTFDFIFFILYNQNKPMKTVTAKYARQNFAEILNEVHFGRKKILVTRSGKPLVVLVSMKEYESEKENK